MRARARVVQRGARGDGDRRKAAARVHPIGSGAACRPASTTRTSVRRNAIEDRSSARTLARARALRCSVRRQSAAVVAIAVSYARFAIRGLAAPLLPISRMRSRRLRRRVIEVQRNLDTTGDQLAALEAKVAQSTDLTLASLGPDARVVHLAPLPGISVRRRHRRAQSCRGQRNDPGERSATDARRQGVRGLVDR